MTLYQIWDLASYIAGKFNASGAITPSRFNILIPQVQDEFFAGLYTQIQVARKAGDKKLLAELLTTSPLYVFKESKVLTAGTFGEVNLPTDYLQHISAQTIYAGANNSGGNLIRVIDIVSESEFAEKQSSIFTRADVFPFAKIFGSQIKVVPYDIEDFTFEYFRNPTLPYMDYCQDSASPTLMIYMPVGSSIYLDDANVPSLYDSSGTLIKSGVSKSGTYPIESQTVELEWPEDVHWRFVYFVLVKCAINLSEDKVAQMAIELTK